MSAKGDAEMEQYIKELAGKLKKLKREELEYIKKVIESCALKREKE